MGTVRMVEPALLIVKTTLRPACEYLKNCSFNIMNQHCDDPYTIKNQDKDTFEDPVTTIDTPKWTPSRTQTRAR